MNCGHELCNGRRYQNWSTGQFHGTFVKIVSGETISAHHMIKLSTNVSAAFIAILP